MNSAGFPKTVSIEEAFRTLEVLSKRYPPQPKTVHVARLQPGRVLAEDIEAVEDIPAERKSIVDGFAIIVNKPGTKRRIVGSSTAVTPYDAQLQQGECVRITNGGVVPDGADTVVPFEDVLLYGEMDSIEVITKLDKGENIRERGSEANVGDILLRDGYRLDSISIGLIYKLGISQVEIYKKPRVSLISIGNESSHQRMNGNFNRSQLLALFKIQGFKSIDAGECADILVEIEKKLNTAAEFSCVIVATGGYEQILNLAEKLNLTVAFNKISSNPGKFAFAHGSIKNKPVFLCVLPQKPASAWIGANLFVSPFLRAMEGRTVTNGMRWKSKLAESIPKSCETRFVRVQSEFINGKLISTPASSDIFSRANSILKIPANFAYSAKDTVNVLLVESP
ncbi:hypothetical protein GCK72_017659 [Caenorhabditis remanei]|uniref:MoeA N-terminal and linker domain-containing protein n=1 Tax=Caenorhabditis remanei TaxID=31234 RepID=A0A6A5G8V1_CAERE|nr:hypothetical protein GCK72_017659 [Caenorhabditis remanei]KAF1751105.1 hypothetical protein GCK72_017659 [Caenorhabditis remanei]